ncbi:MAG: tetratricopeptide repeat protein [Verrucomicrobiales bacterium]|nr:tetratricopeptide repeat protein [Verrucomicrobiales bacterium]
MNSRFRHASLRRLSPALLILVASTPAIPTQAALDFLKRDNEKPSETQQSTSEGAANALLAEAQNREASSQFGKARDLYETVVKKYPRTTAAAESQFKVGEILQVDGKNKKAFEAFQKLLTEYKNTPRYTEAVQRQYTIAEELRNNGSKGFLGGIGADIQPSQLIEFYEQISTNAPRTELAAQSRIAIGSIHAKQGELAEAIVAFEAVVREYPGTKYASEAQYNLFQLHGREANQSFSPMDLRQQREAGEDFLNQFGADPRSQDIRSALGELSEKEASKAYDIGRFYEKSGDLKAAAIYYREALRLPSGKHAADAQSRLSGIIEKDPSLAQVAQAKRVSRSDGSAGSIPIAPPKLELPQTPAAPQAPAAPAAAAPAPAAPAFQGEKPRLRATGDDVLPIPTDVPTPAPGN